MVQRVAEMVYTTPGADTARARVVSLAEAMEGQRRKSEQLAQTLNKQKVGVDLLGSVSQSATAKITSLTNTVGPLGAGLGAISRSVDPAVNGLVRWASAAERASLLNRLLNTTIFATASAAAVGGVAIGAIIDDAIRAGDTYAALHARIRTFSDGLISTAENERAIYQASKDARVGVGDLTTLYTRLAPAVKDYGRSQQDALKITQLTSKALAIQGADVREQAAATVQFSQAIASGVLRGDELRSLLESSPQLLRYIAQNLEVNGKVGVAFSALRKLGEAGALSTDKIISALLKAQPAIERDFINAPKTAQQGWVVLKDQITRTVGTIDQTLGGQRAVVDWLGKMAQAAEQWRQKMLVDPRALDGVRQAADFIGDAVGSIGTLGKVAVENFDALVTAGEGIIALKLGSVMASWFAAAAQGAKGAIGDLRAFQETARFQAGATAQPVLAQAAQAARSASAAADLRATELRSAADLKAAQAAVAKTAAYSAQNGVNRLKIQLEQQGVAVGLREIQVNEAQAAASALAAGAARAEAQAKAAATAATTASGAASIRATVAKEAEALVTANVTRGMLIQQTAMKVGIGLYNLMGGAIGVATLAIGGLIWAVLEAQRAEKAHYDAIRDTVQITDQLRAATQEMTAATWAEIPGIQAKTKALRDQAAAQEALQRKELQGKQARLEQIKSDLGKARSPEESQGLLYEGAALERQIRLLGGALGNASLNAASREQAAYRERIVAASKEKGDAQAQLDRGTDIAGRTLTADQKAALNKVVTERTAYLQAQVDKLSADKAIVDKQIELADKPRPRGQTVSAADRTGLGSLSQSLGEMLNFASEGAQPSRTGTPPAPTTKPKKVAVPGGVSAAYEDLLRAGFLNLTGGQGYAANNGQVNLNGAAVKARSEDEATALAKYVKTVESLNDATDAQIKKKAEALGVSVKSRDELKLAAGAVLADELATSKASQADERWQDIKAEMAGATRSEIKAENDLQRLKKDGAKLTDDDVKAYKAWIAAREAAAKLAERLQMATPLVQRGFETAALGQVDPTDSRGVVDETEAVRRVQAARAAVLLDMDRAVREEIARRRRTGELSELDEAKAAVDLRAGYIVAVEIQTQDQILEIRRQRLQQDAQAAEQQAKDSADAVVGALKDATFGAEVGDMGKRLVNDLLSSIYDELLGNPMRLLIKTAIKDLTSVGGSGNGGGLWKNLLNVGMGYFGKADLSTTVSQTIAKNPNLFADGRVPGYADGRMVGPIFRGRGGPRGDDNLVRVSDGEAIINAASTRRYSAALDAMNRGVYEEFVYGPRYGRFAGGFVPTSAPQPHVPASAITRREGDVILNNNTGVPMTASRREDERGNTHLDLRPLADQMAGSAGRSGALRRGLDQSPRPTKRA